MKQKCLPITSLLYGIGKESRTLKILFLRQECLPIASFRYNQNLNLVGIHRIELWYLACKTSILPLNYIPESGGSRRTRTSEAETTNLQSAPFAALVYFHNSLRIKNVGFVQPQWYFCTSLINTSLVATQTNPLSSLFYLAEGTGFEPARVLPRRFSKPLHYRYAIPLSLYIITYYVFH